jgi:hypothetical protein
MVQAIGMKSLNIANVRVGGFKSSIALQPVSIDGTVRLERSRWRCLYEFGVQQK